MKHYINQIVIMCLCLLCGTAYGQGTGYLYQNSVDGWQNMIRYHSNSVKYITYSWAAGGTENHFAITDIHGSMVDAHVANGYFVQDFEILGDYVFFCGYNASMSGFIGWFNIIDIFNNPTTLDRAHIDETLGTYGLEQLDDIEVYYDRFGRIHIAGVGQCIVSGYTAYKGFEAVGYTVNSMQYKVADLRGVGMLPKLAVTDDFVVYVTGENNYCGTGVGYTLEPFPKDDMFALSTHSSYFFQTVVAGTCIPPNAYDPYSAIGITYKENNTIAVCNYRCGFTTYDIVRCAYAINNNFLFVLREYDLAPLLSSNPIQMITDARINLPLGVGGIRKLAYDPQTKHYITLHRNEVSSGVFEDAVLTMDYSSGIPLTAKAIYQQAFPNGYLWDMCLDGSLRYTASGFDFTTYHKYYFWHDAILSNSPTCANYLYYNVDDKGVQVHKEDVCLSNVVGWIVLNYISNIPIVTYSAVNNLICN